MNVLSLFDGMSCGRIALKELGINPNIYYASETQQYKMCGNGWNIETIKHIFSFMNLQTI